MAPDKYGKVAVLLGGESNEREISIQSGKAVFEALQSCNIDSFLVDITKVTVFIGNIYLLIYKVLL